MISIQSTADFDRAMEEAMDPDLRRLLLLRREQLTAGTTSDLGDLVHIVVAGKWDALGMIEAEVGFPLVGDDAAVDWVRRRPGGWLEAATDQAGVATSVFVSNCICCDPALLVPLLAAAA